jgi:hypothetical protein
MKVTNKSSYTSAYALADQSFEALNRGIKMNNTIKTNKTLPKLTCLVTGNSRTSNIKYLEAKAIRLGVDVDTLINNYVSRDALKLLRTGKTLEQVRAELSVAEGFTPSTPAAKVEELIRINSKGKHSQE